ncbi:mitochondrial carrier protein Mtm1p [[Candida] anglica]|uniref:Mitochondrial thiamine pyrophosphate carrier 1 n=1 Tax=[Candida] anglica TaxID=148631 RepID=A0ABP0EJ69_9ASCO
MISSEIAGAIEETDLRFGRPPAEIKPVANSEDITLSQRMISACSGSFITSLVVTPFDVVRIRIQQQEILPATCCEVPPPTSNIGNTLKNGLTRNTLTEAVTSSAASKPELFWVSQHYCKAAENCSKINSTFQGFGVIARSEGLPTLWRGLSLTLLMAIPSNIIYFTGYEYIRDHSPLKSHFINPLLCGSLARIMAATFIAPIELVKTRLQAIPLEKNGKNGGASPKMLTHLLKDSLAVVKERGPSSLFKGLQITLWRDVPFSGIYWSCYELLKSQIGSVLKAEFDSSKNDDLKVFTTSFLSGSIAGTVAALCTNPFDVGKTRLQITSDMTKGNAPKPSMFNFLVSIYRREGMKALYSGIWPRIMKIAPSCAIMISSYEIGKKFFKKENNK